MGLKPKCAVVVATVRALKLHGGAPPVVAGRPLPKEYSGEDLEVLGKGCANVAHHVACLSQKFNVRVVVAVNKFATDTANELQLVREAGLRAGAHYAVVADHWAQRATALWTWLKPSSRRVPRNIRRSGTSTPC